MEGRRNVPDPGGIDAARRALGRRLAAQRKTVGYTQLELADQLGYSRSTIANVESGRQQVPHRFWQRCDPLLGAGGELVSAAEDLEALRLEHERRVSAEANAAREAKAAVFRAAHQAALQSAADFELLEQGGEPNDHSARAIPGHNLDGRSRLHPAEEDDVERRTLLQLLSMLGVGTAIPIDAIEHLRGDIEAFIEPNNDLALEDWERIAWEYGYTVVRQAPGHVVADLAVDLHELRRLFRRSTDPRVRAGLLGVSAQLSAWMADELHSLGMLGPAWRWWRTARTAADQSGDRDLRVWVRAREAFNAFHSVRPATSVLALADEAVHIAAGTPSLGLVEAHKNRAYAFMRQGDETKARVALDDMRRAFEGLPGDVASDVHSLWGWPERIMYMVDSHIYTAFGAPEAASAQERALALYPPQWRTDVTRIKLLQSITLIRDGDIGDGLQHAGTAMMAIRQGIHGHQSVLWAGRQVLDALPDDRARALPAAKELQAMISP
jgi:transcriptional regulator with XRE-family HTH domain